MQLWIFEYGERTSETYYQILHSLSSDKGFFHGRGLGSMTRILFRRIARDTLFPSSAFLPFPGQNADQTRKLRGSVFIMTPLFVVGRRSSFRASMRSEGCRCRCGRCGGCGLARSALHPDPDPDPDQSWHPSRLSRKRGAGDLATDRLPSVYPALRGAVSTYDSRSDC